MVAFSSPTLRRIGDAVLCDCHLAIRKHRLIFHLIANQDENELTIDTVLLRRGSCTPPEPGREGVGLGESHPRPIALGWNDTRLHSVPTSHTSSTNPSPHCVHPLSWRSVFSCSIRRVIVETDSKMIASRVSRPRRTQHQSSSASRRSGMLTGR